jgi:hypothetical protein
MILRRSIDVAFEITVSAYAQGRTSEWVKQVLGF